MTVLTARGAKQLASEITGDHARLSRIHNDGAPAPQTVVDWLTKLKNLTDVPFDYLVPAAGMLPPESLRFFQADPNWTFSLIEGAYSVARATRGDLQHDRAVAPKIYSALAPKPTGAGQGAPSTPAPISGFLLRSALVSGWPSLQVTVTLCDKTTPKAPLRFDRYADILLYMVEGILETVTFQEPTEGLHFGLDKETNDGIKPAKSLRARDGALLPGASVDLPWRDGKSARGVLAVSDLACAMADRLKGQFDNFTPAEFALEMIEGVEKATLTIGKCPAPPAK